MPRPAQTPLEVEVSFSPDGRIRVVAPRQAGVSYEDAAPRLAAFSAALSAEYGLPVDLIDAAPEQHSHGPRTQTVGRPSFASGQGS